MIYFYGSCLLSSFREISNKLPAKRFQRVTFIKHFDTPVNATAKSWVASKFGVGRKMPLGRVVILNILKILSWFIVNVIVRTRNFAVRWKWVFTKCEINKLSRNNTITTNSLKSTNHQENI